MRIVRKKTWGLLFASLFLVIALFLFFRFMTTKVVIPVTTATLNYVYNGQNIHEQLSEEESDMVRSMVNGKRAYADNPSCGFTSDVSITFDDCKLLIACDGCGYIEYNGKYINISDEDRELINELFIKYGGNFPCI